MNNTALKTFIKSMPDDKRECLVKALESLPWLAIKYNTIAELYLATTEALPEMVKEIESQNELKPAL